MMLRNFIVAAAFLAVLGTAPAWAQSQQVPVCSSRDGAQILLQGNAGAALPDGCRRAMIRRLDTPAGAVCVLEFGQQDNGIIGAVRDAVITTEWWTACTNLRAP